MDEIQLNKTNEELEKLGQEIVDYMKDFLVSNDKVKTGKLKDSVKYNLTSDGSGKFEIKIESLQYMDSVDKGMKVKPYSDAPSYINRLKFKGNDVPPTNIYEETKKWIFNQKKDEIAEATGKDIKDYIQNLFNSK